MAKKKLQLGDRLRNLERRFFTPESTPPIAAKTEARSPEERKKALAEVIGIRNERILTKLLEMEISPEIATALTAIPFLEIAWADGEVDPEEREAVLQCALRLGFTPGTLEYGLLEQWLLQRPEPKLLTAWAHCIEGMCEQLSAADVRALKTSFLAHARTVAQATGGVFGLGPRISMSEATILRSLEAAFTP